MDSIAADNGTTCCTSRSISRLTAANLRSFSDYCACDIYQSYYKASPAAEP